MTYVESRDTLYHTQHDCVHNKMEICSKCNGKLMIGFLREAVLTLREIRWFKCGHSWPHSEIRITLIVLSQSGLPCDKRFVKAHLKHYN